MNLESSKVYVVDISIQNFITHCTASFCSGMMMLQTTNDIFNESLYGLATPDALLAWHRVRLANWLATGGEEWAEYVSLYNSGVCN